MSIAAGVFFYSKKNNSYLFLLRNDNKNPTWSIPGGKIENNETLLEGLERECIEEMNISLQNKKLIPIQIFVNNNNFTYHTFFCPVDFEFIPTLNDEHCGYAWVEESQYPKPLHPGVFSTVNFDVVKEKLKTITTEKRA